MPDSARGGTRHIYPVFLPDGRHFLYVALGPAGVANLKVGALDSTETTVVMPVAEGVGMNITSDYFGSFAASAGGVLAYGQGTRGRSSQLSWFDRTGQPLGTASEPDDWRSVAMSPDERHVAASRFDGSGTDIWTLDLERSLSSRFTFDAKVSINNSPAWSPDGSRLAFHQGNALAFGSCL